MFSYNKLFNPMFYEKLLSHFHDTIFFQNTSKFKFVIFHNN
jgi:hypothetical protein